MRQFFGQALRAEVERSLLLDAKVKAFDTSLRKAREMRPPGAGCVDEDTGRAWAFPWEKAAYQRRSSRGNAEQAFAIAPLRTTDDLRAFNNADRIARTRLSQNAIVWTATTMRRRSSVLATRGLERGSSLGAARRAEGRRLIARS